MREEEESRDEEDDKEEELRDEGDDKDDKERDLSDPDQSDVGEDQEFTERQREILQYGGAEKQEVDMEEVADEGARLPEDLVVVSREEWGAKPPLQVYPKPHLATTIMFTYSTKSKECFTKNKCSKRSRNIQKRYMRVGYPDVPYNFMVGGDGRVYEGRGWNALPQVRPAYKKLTAFMIEIAFIGNYILKRPGELMFDAALDLIQYGRVNFLVRDRFGLIENYE